MRKLFLVTVSFLSIFSVQAQKVGYFNSQEILKDNPTAKKIDSSLKDYVDILKSGFTYLQDEYTEKSNKLKDSIKLDDIKKSLLKQDVEEIAQKLNNYQNEATEKLTSKRNELLNPLTKKISTIVEAYAKENHYDIILDIAATPIYYGNKLNDITEILKNKLK